MYKKDNIIALDNFIALSVADLQKLTLTKTRFSNVFRKGTFEIKSSNICLTFYFSRSFLLNSKREFLDLWGL